MPQYTLRRTVLEIINAVEEKLGYSPSASLGSNRLTPVYLQLLNEIINTCDNAFDWQETYFESPMYINKDMNFTTAYHNPLYDPDNPTNETWAIKKIEEVRYEDRAGRLRFIEAEQMRNLTQIGARGMPTFWTVLGYNVQNEEPLIRLYPIPGEEEHGKSLVISGYVRHPRYNTMDGEEKPLFPANILILGLYAKALAEADDADGSRGFQLAWQDFANELRETANRYTNDTGRDLFINPTGSDYA